MSQFETICDLAYRDRRLGLLSCLSLLILSLKEAHHTNSSTLRRYTSSHSEISVCRILHDCMDQQAQQATEHCLTLHLLS